MLSAERLLEWLKDYKNWDDVGHALFCCALLAGMLPVAVGRHIYSDWSPITSQDYICAVRDSFDWLVLALVLAVLWPLAGWLARTPVRLYLYARQ
jgi:hypothetical protein